MTNKSIYLLSSNGNWAKLQIIDISLAETSFSIADVDDLTKRKDTFTTNITVKGTKHNNQVLGNCFNLNAYNVSAQSEELFYNFNINGQVDCLYYENDSLISKGLFKVTEVVVNGKNVTYQCAITGYRINFFAKLSDKLLSDLDFTEYNHNYTLTNIQNSWNTSVIKNGSSIPFQLGRGYVYGFADYGTSIYGDKATVDQTSFKDYRPSFYLKEYLDKIFAQDVLDGYSYSIEGSSEFRQMFNALIVPNNSESLANYLNSQQLMSVSKNNNQSFPTGDYQYANDDGNNPQLLKIAPNWTTTSLDTGYFILNSNNSYAGYSNNVFTATRSTTTTIEVSSGIRFETYFPRNGRSEDVITATATMYLLQRPNGTAQWSRIASAPQQRIHTDGANWQTGVYTFKLKTNITVTEGSQLMIAYEFTDYHMAWGGPIPLVKQYLVGILVGQNSFVNIGDKAFTSKVELNENDTIDFKNLQSLSSYKQQDFIKSLQNLFNLYVYSNIDNPKHIIFEPYNDYYTLCTTANIKGNAINWSNKIDYSNYNKKPYQAIYKNYKFQYKEDGDYLNSVITNKYGSTYGNFTYSNSTKIFIEDNSIELIFASTPVVAWENSTRVLPLFFNYDSSGNKVPKQTILRLMFYNGLQGCASYSIGRWTQNNSGAWSYSTMLSNRTAYAQFHTTHLATNYDLNWNAPDEVFYTYSTTPKYLYQQFYQNQINEYNDSNTVTLDADVLLNEIDISNLDFKRPVFFDSPNGNGYYKLLTVNYGDNSSPSSVTFQKIFLADNYSVSNYFNSEIDGYVTKSSCTTSESVYINVPEGKYTSTISQIDADNQALAEYNQLKVTLANTPVCIDGEVVFNLTYSFIPINACSLVPDGEYYTTTGAMSIGAILFKESNNRYIRCQSGFYSDTANYWQIGENGEIIATGACGDANLNAIVLAYSLGDLQACQDAQNGINLGTFYYKYYLQGGEVLYQDISGTIPANSGYYSDAFNNFEVDATGYILSYQACF